MEWSGTGLLPACSNSMCCVHTTRLEPESIYTTHSGQASRKQCCTLDGKKDVPKSNCRAGMMAVPEVYMVPFSGCTHALALVSTACTRAVSDLNDILSAAMFSSTHGWCAAARSLIDKPGLGARLSPLVLNQQPPSAPRTPSKLHRGTAWLSINGAPRARRATGTSKAAAAAATIAAACSFHMRVS